MEMKLVFPTEVYRAEWHDYIKEVEFLNEKITPLALKYNIDIYDDYLEKVNNSSLGIDLKEGIVPSDVYFLVNENKRILGAIDIRYELTDYLLKFGGNIGYGVRPSERRNGYASLMLKLALEKCMEKGLNKVLVTCSKSNEGSAKVIKNNYGVLENEVFEDDDLKLRFWITLEKDTI